MCTHTSLADITRLGELAKLREKQVCTPLHGGPCTDPNCKRVHLGCAGTNIWCAVSQDEFNRPGQQRVCARHFASVHPFAYESSSLKNTTCNGCDHVHVSPSADMPGCFETVAKVPRGFTLESM